MKIYDSLGIARDTKHISAVERLFTLKKKSGSSPWPVIEECLKIWQSIHPQEWKSFLYDVSLTRQTRRDKYASSDPKKDKVHGGIIRYTLDIPEKVYYMIRCIYSVEELPLDGEEFWRAWAKRFPKMVIPEKI